MEYKFFGWQQADIPAVGDEYKQIKNPRHLYDLLSEIWCADTCAPRMRNGWTKENMTLGQCSVTAFLAQDIFGGDVYGILRPGGNYHCYNVVGNCIFDLTSEQFGDEVLCYENNPIQLREVHFAKEEKRLRYEYLKEELRKKLHGNSAEMGCRHNLMNNFAIHFLNYEDQPVTQEAVDKLILNIRKNRIADAWLALDEYGEEDFLSVDIAKGWTALSFNTWDEEGEAHQYQPINPKYEKSKEDAPVNIGGQTPVLKRNALDDLDLAAECVLHFAKTGELYSGLKWEEAE